MKFKALIGTSALAMVVATPAYAQNNTIDDNVIIVTATLRAANVQDIPLAVTAVSPDELQRQNVQDIRTLGSITPSFNLQSSQSETQGTSFVFAALAPQVTTQALKAQSACSLTASTNRAPV